MSSANTSEEEVRHVSLCVGHLIQPEVAKSREAIDAYTRYLVHLELHKP